MIDPEKMNEAMHDVHTFLKGKLGDDFHFALFVYTENQGGTTSQSVAATLSEEFLAGLMLEFLNGIGALEQTGISAFRALNDDEDDEDQEKGGAPTLN